MRSPPVRPPGRPNFSATPNVGDMVNFIKKGYRYDFGDVDPQGNSQTQALTLRCSWATLPGGPNKPCTDLALVPVDSEWTEVFLNVDRPPRGVSSAGQKRHGRVP